MAGRTHYEVLGVRNSASEEELQKAYRSRARATHPDVPGGDEEEFKAAEYAYHILSDSLRRLDYDLTLRDHDAPGSSTASGSPSSSTSRPSTASAGSPTASAAGPSFTTSGSSSRASTYATYPNEAPTDGRVKTRSRRRDDLDSRLAALGWASLMKTFAAVTATVLVGFAARVTGLACRLLGVHPGQLTLTGRYHPFPSLPVATDSGASLLFVAFIGFGLLIWLTHQWQRRVLLGRVRWFEAPLVAGMLATVVATGELLIDRPLVLAGLLVLGGGYATYLGVVSRRIRLPRFRVFHAR